MKVYLNLQAAALLLYKIIVTFLTSSHAKFHTVMCGDLLDTAVKIKMLNFVLYKYYNGTRCLSEDNKGVCPELGNSTHSVVYVTKFHSITFVIIQINHQPDATIFQFIF